MTFEFSRPTCRPALRPVDFRLPFSSSKLSISERGLQHCSYGEGVALRTYGVEESYRNIITYPLSSDISDFYLSVIRNSFRSLRFVLAALVLASCALFCGDIWNLPFDLRKVYLNRFMVVVFSYTGDSFLRYYVTKFGRSIPTFQICFLS